MLGEFYLFDYFFSLSFLIVQVQILSCTVCLWLYWYIGVYIHVPLRT